MSENTNNQTAVNLGCIFAKKAGMTKMFTEDGESMAITVLSLQDDTVVTQVKTKDKEGYESVQLGFGAKKAQRVNKATKGHFQKAGQPGFYHVEEFRLTKPDANLAAGAVLSPEFLQAGSFIDIRGLTKGKGFQGVMKRWNFSGIGASHGHSVSHRSPGSIGNRADPGRVFPGKKMATHMGQDMQTTENLKVVAYDAEQKLLLVAGAVPGGKNGIVRLTKARKKGAAKKA